MPTTDYLHLNEQQLDMLRLFKNPMKEEDFIQMRRLAVKLLGKRLDDVMDEWEKKNKIIAETYEDKSKGHLRKSTNSPE